MRYDLRGAGKTEAPIPSKTPYSFVDDLHQLLAYLKIDKVALTEREVRGDRRRMEREHAERAARWPADGGLPLRRRRGGHLR